MLEVKTTIHCEYSETDLKQLIIADLARRQIHVGSADIRVSISGGYADESWKQYSGGRAPSQTEVIPVKFVGFIVHSEKKLEPPKLNTRAGLDNVG